MQKELDTSGLAMVNRNYERVKMQQAMMRRNESVQGRKIKSVKKQSLGEFLDSEKGKKVLLAGLGIASLGFMLAVAYAATKTSMQGVEIDHLGNIISQTTGIVTPEQVFEQMGENFMDFVGKTFGGR